MINIQQNIPLKNYTTFRIGGPAKFFVEVKSEEELIEALKYAKDNNLEFFILGGGSNLLVNDDGFRGLVIKLQIASYKLQKDIIEADAGVPLALIVNLAVQNSLSRMEWAAGIPGTIGGAVRGNAGAFGGNTGNIVQTVKVINAKDLKIKIYNSTECEFAYRSSIFKKNKNLIILSAILNLQPGNIEEIQKKTKEIISKRIAKHPKGGSTGSFFINPVVNDERLKEEFKKDTGEVSRNGKLPAGWLVDQLDLRGKTVGGATIAKEHGNWIVNTGQATAEDVIMLVSIIKQQVRDKFGIELEEEAQYLGF
jgi:UDP-N-acetylmuramate dehydrogenase